MRQRLLIIFLIIGSVLLARFGLTRGTPALGLIIPAVFIVSKLLGQPKKIFIFILFLNSLPILIPGLPQIISLTVLSQAIMIGWALLDVSIRQEKKIFSYQRGIDVWLAVFLANILFIMAVRGAGFRLLGGSVYGGAAYVTLLMAGFFYFSAVRIRMTERDVKVMMWILFGAALLYAFAEVMVYYFSGVFGWVSRIILFAYGERGSDPSELVEDLTAVRWHSFRGLAAMMLPVAFVWCRGKTRVAIAAVAILLVGLSGFRSILVQTVALIFLTGILFSKNRVKIFVLWLLIGLAGLGFLIVATPMLPPTIQRTVSFIPFLDIDPQIALTSKQSSQFRFDMWKDYCIPNIPKYLLIGRGLAQDITRFSWMSRDVYRSGEFFYFMGSYHSGPFDLLLTYGLAGTVSFTLFFLAVIVDGWKTVRRYARQDTFAARYYTYLTLWLTFEIAAFYFIFGQVSSMLFLYLAIAALMRIIKKNFLMGEPGAEKAEDGGQKAEDGRTDRPPTAGKVRPVNGWARRRIGARS